MSIQSDLHLYTVVHCNANPPVSNRKQKSSESRTLLSENSLVRQPGYCVMPSLGLHVIDGFWILDSLPGFWTPELAHIRTHLAFRLPFLPEVLALVCSESGIQVTTYALGANLKELRPIR
jgi:hypothetical protein